MKKSISIIGAFIAGTTIFLSCSKTAFLNTKPNASLVVPSSISDYQALLDDDVTMNGAGNNGVSPALGEAGSTDYYFPVRFFHILTAQQVNEYTWSNDPYPGSYLNDWDYPYRAIFTANSALDGLASINPDNEYLAAYNNVKGSAYFFRAFNFYTLAQVFALPYDSSTASTNLGIPLRLSSDINEKIFRATISQTYSQIISDLKASIPLLPVTPLYGTRPCLGAAYALLARTYQTMGNYTNALLYADSCLQIDNTLIDYNTLNMNALYPIPRFNVENLFDCTMVHNTLLTLSVIDSGLLSSYNANDLRPDAFFYSFLGATYYGQSYDGSYNPYSGIATDEVYLIRAESYARLGQVQNAMNDLNTLLVKRYTTNTYTPYNIATADSALKVILLERRKELIFRGLRWTDLRRLNTYPEFAVVLTRLSEGNTYTLSPGDPRYTWLIPDPVINANPGMEQNSR
jgi:tetratricopeptide (TPR) repeat protein